MGEKVAYQHTIQAATERAFSTESLTIDYDKRLVAEKLDELKKNHTRIGFPAAAAELVGYPHVTECLALLFDEKYKSLDIYLYDEPVKRRALMCMAEYEIGSWKGNKVLAAREEVKGNCDKQIVELERFKVLLTEEVGSGGEVK
ncbi:MAG: hypothetical protein U1C50_03775 [Patescibacteria group bacterium]|nr:hypothetical protein [Candidatus Beckwithbacteria bacterium]MDZ4229342.1 hypothetical protein [Patescibacteria group bacterium]